MSDLGFFFFFFVQPGLDNNTTGRDKHHAIYTSLHLALVISDMHLFQCVILGYRLGDSEARIRALELILL